MEKCGWLHLAQLWYMGKSLSQFLSFIGSACWHCNRKDKDVRQKGVTDGKETRSGTSVFVHFLNVILSHSNKNLDWHLTLLHVGHPPKQRKGKL